MADAIGQPDARKVIDAMNGDRASEYRRKAEECRTKAAKATDSATRFELLTMANSWELLARQAEKDEKPG